MDKANCCDCGKQDEKEKMNWGYNNKYTPENGLKEEWFVCNDCWEKRGLTALLDEPPPKS